ncbi:hypothetical protein E2C01_087781 [Portunus trituberculatus]|uniref:Uncharacterized protein n=1 Tax=Portunus trituberculatus TaxID=210409 RepID=A0A5B7JHE6_PORTR|nr:hypothetical protein [Portunus trituberculatus]
MLAVFTCIYFYPSICLSDAPSALAVTSHFPSFTDSQAGKENGVKLDTTESHKQALPDRPTRQKQSGPSLAYTCPLLAHTLSTPCA